jgi:S1-C subfamily serine protease
MHRDGKGLPANSLEALTWFRRAQAKGSASAVRNLATMQQKGLGMEKDWVAARKLFRQAAEAGDAEAQLYMGWMHKTGEVGAEVSYDEAIKWYTMAAEQGQSDAQYQLGQMYQKGSGVQRDRVKALKLYQSAAKGTEEKEQEAARRSVEAHELPRQFINRYSWSLISPGDRSVLDTMMNVFPEIKIAFSLTPAKSVIANMSDLDAPPGAAVAADSAPGATARVVSAVPPAPRLGSTRDESTATPDAVLNPGTSTTTVAVGTPAPTAVAPASKVRGSGWVCDYGLIVTNYHLVKGSDDIFALIHGKREPCEVFATDVESDLVLLKPTARIRMPDALPISGRRLKSGDQVYAVGFGVKAERSEIVYSPGKIRADAGFDNDKLYTIMMSISSESSGGPLLNDRGQVVGIVLDKQQPAIEELAEGGTDETELAGRRNYAVKANQVRLMLRNVKSYDRTSTILFGTNDIDEILEKMRASVVLVTVE